MRVLPLALLLVFALPLAAQTQPAVIALDSVGITVSDMERAVDFYSGVLSFRKVSDVELAGNDWEHFTGVFGLRVRIVRMQLGGEFIELAQFLAPEGRPLPVDSRSNDRWFQHVAIITSDMQKAYAHLRAHNVRHASSGPQRLPEWNRNAGGIEAFYFKDPDGHALEVLHFPAGKGDPKWQSTSALFLGIDHTAITVSDTGASLVFYRDALGMRVAGESENYGTEQEHLNNVFGARLRITALRAASGPGVELLEYLAPRDGRPYPADWRASDLGHWSTRFISPDTGRASQILRNIHARFESPDVTALARSELGFSRGVMVRDPDGHAVQLVQK
ncbi:MAG TPA: VOC family protein [Terriglobales bacterium]|nr:VOC family protein [Terriglobales bacterium]